ncbi:transposon protein, putative, unclassified [Panicum miliaceum]|uniref:Transposon protein, putative, unclassified n=1 Tax=Panicum miliaceum TaxID=4540 RepID=A0A3L6PA72_PANMI|nr:transposon protein, putative, unclassified [Panicum miliaceum]
MMRAPELSQVNELHTKIKELRDEGFTGALVVYSWIGRRIQPLQQCTHFGFEYMGLKDPSRFSTEQIHQAEAVRRVSQVLLDAETVRYMPSKLFTIKNPPKQVGDDVNVYRSMPSMPDIDRPSHLMPSRSAIDSESMEDDEGTNDDRTLAEVIKGTKTKTTQESESSAGGDPLPNHPKGPRAATWKLRASASPGGAEGETPR